MWRFKYCLVCCNWRVSLEIDQYYMMSAMVYSYFFRKLIYFIIRYVELNALPSKKHKLIFPIGLFHEKSSNIGCITIKIKKKSYFFFYVSSHMSENTKTTFEKMFIAYFSRRYHPHISGGFSHISSHISNTADFFFFFFAWLCTDTLSSPSLPLSYGPVFI